MINEKIKAIDAGGKEFNVTVEIDETSVIIFTPYEKIAMSKNELMRLFKEPAKTVDANEAHVEKTWARKEKNNA